jgi:adenosylmethionine-8-amino-7-oxononanoate aminotransferase
MADLADLERRHPGDYPRLIVAGDGAHLIDDRGRRLLDAGGHLGAGLVGHGRREIGTRMAEQAARLEFCALDSGLSHPGAIELADRLAALAPLDDPIVSFSSSGSEANELAFKLARAYHRRRGDPRRVKVLARDGSYHGSTLAGVAATGAPAFRADCEPVPAEFVHFAQPSPGRCGLCRRGDGCALACADALAAAIEREGADTVAAVIAEPVAILQAVKPPHDGYWSRVREICDATGTLLIADEVVTGFGRTGRMFGVEHWDVRPDLMTVAKGIASGYAPLAATLAARHVEDALEPDGPLPHLNTYAGHPVACAAALATLDVLERERLVERAAALERPLRAGLAAAGRRSGRRLGVAAVGLLGGVEIDVSDRDDADELVVRLRHEMYERGLIARCAAGDGVLAIVFYPTLVVAEGELTRGTQALGEALAATIGAEAT